MLHLSAFADEISPDLDEQIRVCRRCGVERIELRSVAGVNVLDFTASQRQAIRQKLANAGLGVISIASPIGKVTLDSDWPTHLARYRIAIEAAQYFDAPFIRLFSFYLPAGQQWTAQNREQVIDRTRTMVDLLDGASVTLLHENEKDIYGSTGSRCLDLIRAVNSPKLRAAFDFANFVQEKERPSENWRLLKEVTAHFHIKDARLSDGTIVPAGQGDGSIREILIDAYRNGYRGFLSMEPHLSVAGQFSGFTGPELFEKAVAALRQLCRDSSIPLAADDYS